MQVVHVISLFIAMSYKDKRKNGDCFERSTKKEKLVNVNKFECFNGIKVTDNWLSIKQSYEVVSPQLQMFGVKPAILELLGYRRLKHNRINTGNLLNHKLILLAASVLYCYQIAYLCCRRKVAQTMHCSRDQQWRTMRHSQLHSLRGKHVYKIVIIRTKSLDTN